MSIIRRLKPLPLFSCNTKTYSEKLRKTKPLLHYPPLNPSIPLSPLYHFPKMPFSQDRLDLPLDALIAETKQQPPSPAKRAYRSFPSQPPRRLHPRPISPEEEPHASRTAPYPTQPVSISRIFWVFQLFVSLCFCYVIT